MPRAQLGVAVGWLIGVLNVRHVLLVGPVAAFGDDWLDEVRRSRPGERPGAAGTRHADRVRPRPRRRGRAGRVGAAHGAAARPGAGRDDRDARAGVRRAAGRRRRRRRHQDLCRRHRRSGPRPLRACRADGPVIARRPDRRPRRRRSAPSCGRTSPPSASPSPATSTPRTARCSMAVNLGITHLPLGPMLQARARRPDLRRARRPRGGALAERAGAPAGRLRRRRASPSSRSAPGSRPASCSTGHCSAATTASPARWATSSPIRTASLCACGLRGCLETIAAGPGHRPPGRRGDRRRSEHRPVAPSECRRCLPRRCRRRRGRRSRSPTAWPTTWPGPSDRSP